MTRIRIIPSCLILLVCAGLPAMAASPVQPVQAIQTIPAGNPAIPASAPIPVVAPVSGPVSGPGPGSMNNPLPPRPATAPNLSVIANNGLLTASQIEALFSGTLDETVYRLRDPFKMPELDVKTAMPKSDLEYYALTDFRLIGILTGPKQVRAMVMTPDNKTFIVSERMKIGNLEGVVTKITPTRILVREKVVNAIGQVEHQESAIVLASTSKDKPGGQALSGAPGTNAGVLGAPGGPNRY